VPRRCAYEAWTGGCQAGERGAPCRLERGSVWKRDATSRPVRAQALLEAKVRTFRPTAVSSPKTAVPVRGATTSTAQDVTSCQSGKRRHQGHHRRCAMPITVDGSRSRSTLPLYASTYAVHVPRPWLIHGSKGNTALCLPTRWRRLSDMDLLATNPVGSFPSRALVRPSKAMARDHSRRMSHSFQDQRPLARC
jgi:hypothetical protein